MENTNLNCIVLLIYGFFSINNLSFIPIWESADAEGQLYLLIYTIFIGILVYMWGPGTNTKEQFKFWGSKNYAWIFDYMEWRVRLVFKGQLYNNLEKPSIH